jgi:dihydroorotase-like cyclic amidohydrolase
LAFVRLPALIDCHVHLRDPGFPHKETFLSGTQAALAGGITTVLDMPNTQPPVTEPEILADKARRAAAQAVCDVGLFYGAAQDGRTPYASTAHLACGLKIYVNETFTTLRIQELPALVRHFAAWPGPGPIAVHAEGMMLAACLALATYYDRRLHVCHVPRRADIELIKRAKARGTAVTCEVTPHHLWLTEEDAIHLGPLGQMRPALASADDRAALWENLDVIDCFATDHAPHSLDEKRSTMPPPGVPGLETMLPLLLTAVGERRLTLDQLVERLHTNPARIFRIPTDAETFVEIDPDARRTITAEGLFTHCGWTPFAGLVTQGVVRKVVLRGQPAFADGQILNPPGSGRVLFAESVLLRKEA